MNKPLSNDRGLTIVECIIALVLTTVAIVSLISMQSLAWRGAGKSDYLGRAVGILQSTLEQNEFSIMTGVIPADSTTCADPDGDVIQCNDARKMFTITRTTVTCLCTAPSSCACPNVSAAPANAWRLNVGIAWPGSANGLNSSIIVSRQTAF